MSFLEQPTMFLPVQLHVEIKHLTLGVNVNTDCYASKALSDIYIFSRYGGHLPDRMALRQVFMIILLVAVGICSADDFMLRLTRESGSPDAGYIAPVKVGDGKIQRNFILSTLATEVAISNCTTSKTSLTIIHRTGFFNDESDVTLTGIRVECSTIGENVLALGPTNGTFPFQFARAKKVSQKFSYCLPGHQGGRGGEIYFGHEGDYRFYFHTDILNSSLVPVTYIPGLEASFFGGYQISLSTIRVGKTTFRANTAMLIGLTVRYTSVPEDVYKALRAQFIGEAGSMKLKKASSTFDGLDVCYSMTSAQLSRFSTLTMNFAGTNWLVPPQNYIQASNKKGVACFAIRNSSQNARGVSAIGTLQQENTVVEYDLGKKKLGVSGSLVANLGLTCDDTRGS